MVKGRYGRLGWPMMTSGITSGHDRSDRVVVDHADCPVVTFLPQSRKVLKQMTRSLIELHSLRGEYYLNSSGSNGLLIPVRLGASMDRVF